jgi:hypothetical protein
MFFPGSRYANAGTYQVTAPDGTTVTATKLPLPAGSGLLGWYKRSAGERLDLLAANFLGDPTAAWALGWTNGAVSLDALAAREYLMIPPATPVASSASTTPAG